MNTVTVVPFYIICDESLSMSGTAIEAVNEGIAELLDGIGADPIIDIRIRVGIIAFNDKVSVLLPLTQVSDITTMPLGCVAGGSASYANIFSFLKTQLENDVTSLGKQFDVSRPLVFFISYGTPNSNDHWRDELNKLIDPTFKFSPNIVSFGVQGAEKSVIAEVAHWGSKTEPKVYFMSEHIANPAPALIEIIKWVCNIGFIVRDVYSDGNIKKNPGYLVTDGETIGNDSVRVYVVEAKK